MGVNTKAVLSSKVGLADIVRAIEEKIGAKTLIHKTHVKHYDIVEFKVGLEEHRRLSVFTKINASEMDFLEEEIELVTLIDLNAWGSSPEIIEKIVEEFGGYMVDRDTSDNWREIRRRKSSGITGDDYLVYITLTNGEKKSKKATSNDRMSAMIEALNRLSQEERSMVKHVEMKLDEEFSF